MSLADEMRMKSSTVVNNDDYMQKLWGKTMSIIENAALKGNNYVCFYDCCHPCDKGYTKDNENKLVNKLKSNGFKVVEKWRIFGGDQISPYIIW